MVAQLLVTAFSIFRVLSHRVAVACNGDPGRTNRAAATARITIVRMSSADARPRRMEVITAGKRIANLHERQPGSYRPQGSEHDESLIATRLGLAAYREPRSLFCWMRSG